MKNRNWDRQSTARLPGSAALLALAMFVAFVAGCTDSSWREIAALDGGFRVLMSGEPRVEKRDLDTPAGKITGYWYSLEQKDSVFGVGYADYPLQMLRGRQPRQMFIVVRESWLKRIAGKPEGDGTDLMLDAKWHGMEFTARGRLDGRDAWMRGRFYLVDNRLYQLVVFGNRQTIPSSDINRFMASFKVAQPRDAATVTIDAGQDGKK